MKTFIKSSLAMRWLATLVGGALAITSARAESQRHEQEDAYEQGAPASEPIPWSEIGVKAEEQYEGDGLSIVPTDQGALLRCIFQKLEGEATSQGLWLTSTAEEDGRERFRIVSRGIGRAKSVQVLQTYLMDSSKPLSGLRKDLSRILDGSLQQIRRHFV